MEADTKDLPIARRTAGGRAPTYVKLGDNKQLTVYSDARTGCVVHLEQTNMAIWQRFALVGSLPHSMLESQSGTREPHQIADKKLDQLVSQKAFVVHVIKSFVS